MGGSSEGNKGIDASVGGLVWVRRRNGKWWPGRILGPDELPDSLPSPKLGTPVKLLGKEDASVDWYNVEKSTRVKAFRCGEYDECIEKAKVAAANTSKKLLKYATREDAILHALEIESARLRIDHPELKKQEKEEHPVQDSPSPFDPREVDSDSAAEITSSSENDSDSAQELPQSGVSFEDLDFNGDFKEQPMQHTPNDSEDDGTEGIKRMKGLDDLGIGVVSSLKRKRSQVAHVHEFLKRKHRRRTVTKILESTRMVSVPVMCENLTHPTRSLPRGASYRKLSGSGSDVSKRTFKLKENNVSSLFPDRLYDVPFVTEEEHLAVADVCPFIHNASQKARVCVGINSSHSSLIESVFWGFEELNESGSTSSGAAEINDISQLVDNGSSKWQSKGKRSRHMSKSRRQDSGKFMDVDGEYNAYVAGAECDIDSSMRLDNSPYCLKSKAVAEIQEVQYRGWSRNASHRDPYVGQTTAELQTQQRLLPYRQSRFSVNPKYQDFALRHHTAESSLFDVNLEVKASYRPQHVPYVSLMSKLSGRPIIGHPLTVEVLDDGYCDSLMSCSECISSSCELDEDLGENTSAMGGVELGLEVRSSLVDRVPVKHTLQHVSLSNSPKSQKNGFLPKKIRKLSSLTGADKRSEAGKELVVEKLQGPCIACVPLTIVFSRINEELNSSVHPIHRS